MAEMEWTRPAPPAAATPGWDWTRNLLGRWLDWEDWLTLALLLAAITSVSVPLENGGWTQNMPALTLVAVLAAVTTLLLTRSRLSWFYTWPLAILAGALVTFWQALIMVGPGTLNERLDAIHYRFQAWFDAAFSGGVSNDSLPFHVMLVGVTWLGVFLFAWSVFRWRNAWIGLVPGGIALFIDLAFVGDSLSSAALLYYLFGFLLIMRTHLVSRIARWRQAGTPYPALLSLTYLNFSTWVLLGIIVLAWITPTGPFNTPGPIKGLVIQTEDVGVNFVRLAGPLHVKKVIPVHNYTGVLPFQGSVKLGARELLGVKVSDSNLQGPFLLRGAVYEKYGSGGWEAGQREKLALNPHAAQHLEDGLKDGSVKGQLVPMDINVLADSVVGSVVFSAGQPVSSDMSLTAEVPSGSVNHRVLNAVPPDPSKSDAQTFTVPPGESAVAPAQDQGPDTKAVDTYNTADLPVPDFVSLEPDGRLDAGQSYNVSSFLPSPSADDLRAAGAAYPDWVRSQYLQLPDTLPSRVGDLARSVATQYLQAQGKPVPGADSAGGQADLSQVPAYDLAQAMQDYLRQLPVDYDVPDTPPGRDTVDYFLFDAQRGYFDYHASAMVVMLRSLGVPARLGVGFVFDESDLNADKGEYTVRDRNSYSWTEVYFPGRGWVVFNPTPDRPADLNPQPVADQSQGPIDLSKFPGLPAGVDPIFASPDPQDQVHVSDATSTSETSTTYNPWFFVGLAAFLALLVGAVVLGWKRSVAGMGYAEQHWEKIVRLASWAGYPPQPGQTVTDYANGVQRRFRGLRGVSVVADAYNRSRFGRRAISEAERLRIGELWPDLRGTLLGAILGRLFRRNKSER